jgi:glycosyltransferase involved in cell wall biosynthesis
MTILYLITKAELGGAQVHLLDLMRGFREKHDLYLGVGDRGYLTEAAEAMGVKCEVIPGLIHAMKPHVDVQGLVNTAKLIRRVKPDLVHAHTSKAGVLGRIAARMAGVPAVFTAHTWCFAEGASRKWKLFGVPAERISGRLGTAIITVSEANRRLALDYGVADDGRIVTVHNGVPDSPMRAELDSQAPIRIVMVARFVPQKAQRMLLKAVANRGLPVEIDFVGDGEMRPQTEALAGELGLASRVNFLGSRKDVEDILSKSHIFALPTNWEGFPLSILEAMRAGLPVVASRVGGIEEAVSDGETGMLSEAGDQEGFENKLAMVVYDRALRLRLGAAGRARYEREFTISAMLRKTQHVYNHVRARREGTPDLSRRSLDSILN